MTLFIEKFVCYDVLNFVPTDHVPTTKVFNHGETASLSVYGYDGSKKNQEKWLSIRASETISTKNGNRTKEIVFTLSGDEAKKWVQHAAKALGMECS